MLRGKYTRGSGFVPAPTPKQEEKAEQQAEKKEEQDLQERQKKMFDQWARFGSK